MKKVFFAFLFLFQITLILAQSDEIYKNSNKYELKNYLEEMPKTLEGNRARILLHHNFGKSKISNISTLGIIKLCEIEKVNLYYSDFPLNQDFSNLNSKRIQTLIDELSPEKLDNAEWSMFKQTSCNTYSEALQLFHGFEIIVKYPDEFKLMSMEIDSTFDDYVVQKVMERNDWTEMLVTTDLTGSMYPYAVQLFIWMKLNTIDGKVKQFVFFNDGDTTPDKLKKIGKTGGIYQTRSNEFEEIERIATQCIVSGDGGDLEENDVEALIKGMQLCPDCKENILIVDNYSNVRDFELLKEIDKPIRVIICGGAKEINPEYLNLARATNGSIHLVEEDILNLMEINEGESILINGIEYQIERNKFKITKEI